MAQKRKEREYDVSDMVEDKGATVHWVVVELSPVMTSVRSPGRKYFKGKVTDGSKVARVVCFDPKLLEKCKEEGEAVALVNCSIQEGKYGYGLEVVATPTTKVESSHKKLVK